MFQVEDVKYEPFAERHCEGAVDLCSALGWESYARSETTLGALTAPGAVSWVAEHDGVIVGLAHLLSNGRVHAHLSLVGVLPALRRLGIARELLRRSFRDSGAKWLDLVAEAGSEPFYRSFIHSEGVGFRIDPTDFSA